MTAPDSRDSELLTRIMNAQPFTDRNDAIRVWQLFRDDVHVGDAIRAILAFAPDPPDRLQALARGPQQAGGEDAKDEVLLAAMRPILDKIDGGYACDMSPEGVVEAGRAAIAAFNGGQDDA